MNSLNERQGLGCPVGTLVAGSREFIEKATTCRKVLGGSMRQAGVIAATGIVALNSMVDRLADDHRNARHIAEGEFPVSYRQTPQFALLVLFCYRSLIDSRQFLQK